MRVLLQPSLTKIILTLTLFALSSYLWRLYVVSTISDTFPWGFPLQFYTAWGPCPPGELCSESSISFLIHDLLFWYLVIGVMVFTLGRKVLDRKEA